MKIQNFERSFIRLRQIFQIQRKRFCSESKYKSKNSDKMILFTSSAGKAIFAKGITNKKLEMYFWISEQTITQSSQFTCSLASAVTVLNTLAIDPERTWKGIWRWFDDQSLLLDLKSEPFFTLVDISIVLLKHKACVKVFFPISPLNEDLSEDQLCINYENIALNCEKIRQELLSTNLLAGKCSVGSQNIVNKTPYDLDLESQVPDIGKNDKIQINYSANESYSANENTQSIIKTHFFHRRACFCSYETFELLLETITETSGIYMIVNYYRPCMDQTGSGHFSPVGGFVDGKILILDVARFKYPFHWVDSRTLYHSFTHGDPQSGVSRGFLLATKFINKQFFIR
jgi:hypothetical protein